MAKDPKSTGGSASLTRRQVRSGSEEQDGNEIARSQAERATQPVRSAFGKQRAARVIAFIEELTVPSGEGAGGRFILREWQRKFIRDIYEPHFKTAKGFRRAVRRAILSIARKNGKTALIAALVLCNLVGPEAIQNGEIYSAANDREQAAQVFKVARQMVELEPELSAIIRVVPSTKTLVCYSNGSFYRAISAEAGTKHGLNPSFAIFDELAQAKNTDLYDVIDSSFGARSEPLFVVISTQSNDPQHILSKLIDDGLHSGDPSIVCHLYAVDEDVEDIFDPACWKAANPALGDFRSLEDMRAAANKAERMASAEPAFRNLNLNQRVSPTASLITRPEWMACATNADKPCTFAPREKIYLGLDMSSVVDLTALVGVSESDPSKIMPFAWKPLDLIEEHSARDFGHGNNRYQEWIDAGHLLTSPGSSIDPRVVVNKVAELYGEYQILGLAYDRWRMKDIIREFDRIGFAAWEDTGGENATGNGLRLIPWGQGYRDMAPAVDALELAVLGEKIKDVDLDDDAPMAPRLPVLKKRSLVHPRNPVLTWAMGNAVATMDPAGNRKIDKEKVRFRIDPAVALTMALGLKARDRTKAPQSPDGFLKGFLVA